MSLSSQKCPVGWVCRPRAALALVLAVSGFSASTAGAGHTRPVGGDASGALVDVDVIVGRRIAPLYQAPSRWDRLYFEALKGRNYSLLVRNKTGERVGVLIAVDGLNVIDGDRSGLSRNEAMYVLDPWEEAEIRGWRTSLRDVRKFVFVDEERSYAERSGKTNGDMGWIRVLAFREEGSHWITGREGRFRDFNAVWRGTGRGRGGPRSVRPQRDSGIPAQDGRTQLRPRRVQSRHRLGRSGPRSGEPHLVRRRTSSNRSVQPALRIRFGAPGARHRRPSPEPPLGAGAGRPRFRPSAEVVDRRRGRDKASAHPMK
jgi:hypothetical protein